MSKFYLVFLLALLQNIHGQLPPQSCVFDPRASKTPKCSCTCRDGKDGRDGRDGRDGNKYSSSSSNDSGFKNELKQLQEKIKELEGKLKKLANLENDVLNFRAARASKNSDTRKSELTKQKFMKAYQKEQEMLELFNVTKPEEPKTKKDKPDLHGSTSSNAVKLNGHGKIPQAVLPAGFDKTTAADIQWQALHMSAASACRGLSKTGGHPGIHNVVLLRNANEGKTCRQLCSKSWADKCEGEVSIWGMLGKGKKNGQEIGNFYNYGCDYGNGGGSEADASPDAIRQDMKEAHQYYFSYCCCSFY